MWFGHKPNLSHRVLSATGYCHIAQENMRKLYPHARKGIFIGYGESTDSYAMWFGDKQNLSHFRVWSYCTREKEKIIPIG